MLPTLVLALAFEPLDIPNDKCGVVISAHEDDRLVVFAMGQDQQIYHKYQMPLGDAPTTDGFTYWSSMGGKFLGGPSVVRDATSKLVLFARGADKGIWMKQQACPPLEQCTCSPLGPLHPGRAASPQLPYPLPHLARHPCNWNSLAAGAQRAAVVYLYLFWRPVFFRSESNPEL